MSFNFPTSFACMVERTLCNSIAIYNIALYCVSIAISCHLYVYEKRFLSLPETIKAEFDVSSA